MSYVYEPEMAATRWFVQGDESNQWFVANTLQTTLLSRIGLKGHAFSDGPETMLFGKEENDGMTYTVPVFKAIVLLQYPQGTFYFFNCVTGTIRRAVNGKRCDLFAHGGTNAVTSARLHDSFPIVNRERFVRDLWSSRKDVAQNTVLLVVRPGGGYSPQNNHGAINEGAGMIGIKRVEPIGYSNLGHGYDRYPCELSDGTQFSSPDCAKSPPHLESFANEVIRRAREIESQGSRVVLWFGSRGGQVVLPEMWRNGHEFPCIVINAGCCRDKVKKWTNQKLALVTMDRDYFRQKDPTLVSEWMRKYAPNARLFTLRDEHMPNLNKVNVAEFISHALF